MAVISDCQPNLPLINADPKLIRIIFQNLLTNSIKYTPDKGKIIFSISRQSKNLIIRVKDNGYGIPAAAKNSIFTKLFRAENIRVHQTEGTGLGLYMVKSIVENAKGKIWFESIENKGTTFFVSLPLAGMRKKDGTKELVNIK